MSESTPPRTWHTLEHTDGVLVVRLAQPKIISWSDIEADVFRREVVDVVTDLPNPPRMVVDMRAAAFVSSGLLGLFISIARSAVARGGDVILCELTPEVADLLRTIDPTSRLFRRARTVESAIARYQQ